MVIRTAVIERRGEVPTRDQVEAFLYSNYKILAALPDRIFITGTDYAGFTLDAIRDRAASGLIFVKEISGDTEVQG
jgi:hypothetical protein